MKKFIRRITSFGIVIIPVTAILLTLTAVLLLLSPGTLMYFMLFCLTIIALAFFASFIVFVLLTLI